MMENELEVNEMDGTNSNATKWRTATMLLLLIQFAALFVALIVLGLKGIAQDSIANQCIIDQDVRVCVTPECIQAASALIAHMNRTANPCDDFYEFACGGWNSSNPMPDDKSDYSVFDILDKRLVQNLKQSLTKTDRRSSNPSWDTTEKMHDYYFQCCHGSTYTTNDQKAWDALRRALASFGLNMENWPFLDNTRIGNFSEDNLVFALSHARRQGNTLGLINPVILRDPGNTAVNVIYFDLPTLTLQRSYYLSQTDPDEMTVASQAYKEYGKELASLVANKLKDSRSSPEDFDQMFSEIIELESVLIQATPQPQQTSVEKRLIKLREMSNYTTPISFSASGWVDYLKRVWPELHERIHADIEVHVRQTNFFESFGAAAARKLINRETGLRLLANYMGFKIIESYLNVLPDEARAISARLDNVLGGVSAQPPRWETCVRLLNKQLPNAVGRMYVQKYFSVEAKAEVEKMVTHLLASFKRIVQESYWMDEETRARAMEKVNKLTPVVAYEDYLMNNDSRVNIEHASFVVQSDLLDTFINAQNFVTEVEGKKLLRVNARSDWISGAATINAYYNPNSNSIHFPAGILSVPFWGHGYPNYWNFAAIGTVIGHEITHGFDDKGSQLDGDGRYVDWWSPKSMAAFRKRADGIVKQYSSYWYLGSQIDGEGTEGDNIADNGGIKQSFMAYQTYIKDVRNGTPEPHLPGFHTFTSEKMFYLSYAQMWCSDLTPQGMKNRQNDAHSPRRFRIIGPVQNSASFAEAYRCAPGTPMNPLIKYGVW